MIEVGETILLVDHGEEDAAYSKASVSLAKVRLMSDNRLMDCGHVNRMFKDELHNFSKVGRMFNTRTSYFFCNRGFEAMLITEYVEKGNDDNVIHTVSVDQYTKDYSNMTRVCYLIDDKLTIGDILRIVV